MLGFRKTLYFNPLPPYGGRQFIHFFFSSNSIFQSTPSVWRETFDSESGMLMEGISIHSLRMEGDVRNFHTPDRLIISIHSLRMEGDVLNAVLFAMPPHFNPLPPYGGRQSILFRITSSGSFQSTPSVWRETALCFYCVNRRTFQSTPSVWRETNIEQQERESKLFQSTPSVWRETVFDRHFLFPPCHFNPLPPYGGRLDVRIIAWIIFCISIHSLRMEGDPVSGLYDAFYGNFNPLPPYGGRQQNCTGKRFSFRLSLYNPAKKDAKDYILHPKK